jgi:tetratricopeptide (TPR) repeat protein
VEIRNNYGIMLRNTDRFDEAIIQFREASRLEPLSRHYHRQIGMALDCAGRYAEALDEFRTALDLDPRYDVGWVYLSATLASLGRYQEAVAARRTAARLQGDSAAMAALADRSDREGYFAAVRAIALAALDTLRAQRDRGEFVSDGEFADAYRAKGDFDGAYRYLAKAVARRDVRALTAFCSVEGPPWPVDSRLAAIRRQMGLR